MSNQVNPLNQSVPIVNSNGTPTWEFMRKWAQQFATNGTIPLPADPTAQVGPNPVPGVALTFMRSDAAPALADTSVSPGTYGDASNYPVFTVDPQGRLTSADQLALPTAAALTLTDGVNTVSDVAQITVTGGVVGGSTPNATLTISGIGSEPSIARFTTVPAQPGFDPAMIYNSGTVLSNSNKTATPASGSPYNYNYGTPARYTGKRYWEVVPGSASFASIGVTGSGGHWVDLLGGSAGNFGTRIPGHIGWTSDGKIQAVSYPGLGTPTVLATYATWSATNVLSFALDIDNLLIWFRVGSGNWNNNASADPATGTLGLSIPMLLSMASNTLVWPGMNMGNTSATTLHLLAADFAQSVPSGFTGWAN